MQEGGESWAGSGIGNIAPCSWDRLETTLRAHGLRPTRQRMWLARIISSKGRRHITADLVYAEANQNGMPVSLATVYNTLRQFTRAGLLRQLPIDGAKCYFDTNNSEHYHFLVDDDAGGQVNLIDIASSELSLDIASVPQGYEVRKIDVVVRLSARARGLAGRPARASAR